MTLCISVTNNKFIRVSIVMDIIIVVVFSSVFINNSWATTGKDQQISFSNQGGGKVFVMYAGSLVRVFENGLGPLFYKDTGYQYTGEGRGSIQIVNMIIDGQRRPDIFVSAGTIPIMRLINSNSSSMNDKPQPLAQWLAKFASAEMVIAYSHSGRFYDDLEKARQGEIPWYQVILKQGFKFGRTDPELDPKGYYMIITAKLSNIFYSDQNIKQRILGDDRNSKQLFPEETLNTALESGQIDAVAAYKHEAIARGLSYITLPPQINLANPSFSDFYRKASYTLGTQTVYGEPIYFSLTIPETVKNLDGSISFVKFLLSTDGESILKNQGLNRIKPIVEGKIDKVPFPIRNIMLGP
jgi:molybdate/tungstate transport system substrate-binding protein